MKRLTPVVLSLILVLLLTGCGHTHTWQEATCTQPATCSECGETQGEPLGHTWSEATCEMPKTCEVCGATEGEPNGHVCEAWVEIVDPTCTEEGYQKGICVHCGQELTVILEKTPHTLGEWEVSRSAEYDASGEKIQRCRLCGEIVNTEEFTFADTLRDKFEIEGDAEGLTVTDMHIIYASTSYVVAGQVTVEVTNESDRSIEIDSAKIDLVDESGKLLLEKRFPRYYSLSRAPKIIEPGEKGYLLCDIMETRETLDVSNGLDVLGHITANATYKTRDQWEVVDCSRGGINPQTVGHVRNANPETYSSFMVYCLYKDEKGRVIAYSAAYHGDSIAPDETVSFSSEAIDGALTSLVDFTSIECIVVGRA